MQPSGSRPKPPRPTIRPPSSTGGLQVDADGWYSAVPGPSQLSASSAGRPPSSASSLRPSSSAPLRPPSSASTRPPSSAGIRSSQSAPLTPLTPDVDPEEFRGAVEYVAKNLDSTVRPSGSTDFATIDKALRGYIRFQVFSWSSKLNTFSHARKARINSFDILGDTLDIVYARLKAHAKSNDDLDASIQTILSTPPNPTILENAEAVLHRIEHPSVAKPKLTWKDILAEEPFEGQHWEGVYGLPRGSTVEGWETRSDGSTPSLSPWDSDSDLDGAQSSSELSVIPETPPPAHSGPRQAGELEEGATIDPRNAYRHRQDVEELQARQYWRPEWRTEAAIEKPFDLGDASSLGAQASIVSAFASLATTLAHLRKFTSAIFARASSSSVSSGTNQAAHLVRSQRRNTQTLEAFADALDTELRAFDTWCAAREESICRARGGILPGPPLVVSLLSLSKSVRDAFGDTFSVLFTLVRGVVQNAQRAPEPPGEVWTFPDLPPRAAPSAVTALLLDALLGAVQARMSMGDAVTARALTRVFGKSAEPVWAMMHRWMRDGMPVRDSPAALVGVRAVGTRVVPDEFFVEDNELVMLDPDFWSDGFTLRVGQTGEGEGGDAPNGLPVFLVHVAELVLSTGKVTGLLRALGISSLFDGDAAEVPDIASGQPWMAGWRLFGALLDESAGAPTEEVLHDILSPEAAIASSENLSHVVYDELLPYAERAHETLTKVLVEDCDLWAHLNAIEDLFLMRRGDAMSHFVDILFTRMDTRQPWNDFHFMNSAFRDVVALHPGGRTRWIDPTLVRFSFRSPTAATQERSAGQTVRALDGLLIEYAVPFPLTYVFGPRTVRVCSAVFTLVLQVRRAKRVLERILVRGGLVGGGRKMDGEMKVFYAVRGRLSWFVNTLLNFITTNVIHTQILKFHDAFRGAKSLDEMVQLQNDHLDKLEGRCLLQRNVSLPIQPCILALTRPQTAALHRAIMSILDMSLHYTECFVAYAGDTTHDISRASLRLVSRRSRHRSRRVRTQRRDVIGFAQAPSLLQDSDGDSSDSEDEGDAEGGGASEPSFSFGASTMSFAEEGPAARLEKMSGELDALVRFVRRGVESLAAGTGEAAPAFGMFAFALEDWDR
ncbi:Gamma-tubulin complex component 5 [Trametes pubescens]|uniref:Gamma-tubulin complex component 5 n=1 Tax=Trametes pubescens TaxID=154538 RepID=A0A1M2VD04_TRAPU|nr:Gamma-tubulin complex component 5 [Trametes pubescens]